MANDDSLQRMIVGSKSDIDGDGFKMTLVPKTTNYLYCDIAANPMTRYWRFRLALFPLSPGYFWRFLQHSRFGMHKEQVAAAPAQFFDRDDIAAAKTTVECANLSLVHESIALNKLEQVCFHMKANDAVRLNYGTGFRIHVIPPSAYLGL